MSSLEAAFAIPPDVRPQAILDRVASAEPARELAEAPLERTYLDTFDWRLYRAGLLLVDERESGRSTLRLGTRNGAPARSVRGRRPAFAPDLPAGWMRERLAPIVGARRLLARVVVSGSLQGLALIDDEEKTLARVVVETVAAEVPGCAPTELPAIVRVEPLRGYDAAAERLRAHLAAMPGLRPLEGGALEQTLRVLGAWPGGDPAHAEVALHPTTRADQALRALLGAELRVVEANEDGVLGDLDVEFLHDLRVACRRSRALLGELGALLDPEPVAAAREGFRWLGERTGALRDLDVFLQGLASWGAADELAPLERAARRLRKRALADVRKALRSERYRALVAAWRAYLDEEPRAAGDNGAVATPIARAARDRVRARAKRVAKLGRSLGPKTPAAKVHRLRLQAKKLRYLLDAFGTVLAPDGAQAVRKRLRRLQDALGAFNDAQNEVALLGRLAGEIEGEKGSAAALLAMGRRQAELERRSAKARRKLKRRVAGLVDDPRLERLSAEPGDGAA
jgi:CHAD domain-containing protein